MHKGWALVEYNNLQAPLPRKCVASHSDSRPSTKSEQYGEIGINLLEVLANEAPHPTSTVADWNANPEPGYPFLWRVISFFVPSRTTARILTGEGLLLGIHQCNVVKESLWRSRAHLGLICDGNQQLLEPNCSTSLLLQEGRPSQIHSNSKYSYIIVKIPYKGNSRVLSGDEDKHDMSFQWAKSSN